MSISQKTFENGLFLLDNKLDEKPELINALWFSLYSSIYHSKFGDYNLVENLNDLFGEPVGDAVLEFLNETQFEDINVSELRHEDLFMSIHKVFSNESKKAEFLNDMSPDYIYSMNIRVNENKDVLDKFVIQTLGSKEIVFDADLRIYTFLINGIMNFINRNIERYDIDELEMLLSRTNKTTKSLTEILEKASIRLSELKKDDVIDG